MIHLATPEIWFVCGSQHLYGPGPLQQVAADARGGRRRAGALAEAAAQGRLQAAADHARRHRQTVPGGERRRQLRRPDPVDAHVFAVENVDPRPDALQKPFVHLHTQFNRDLPWATIDMDFMNLNQSAHGDREAGFIHTRMRLARKVVVGHWSDPEVHDRIGAWMRAARAWHDWQGAQFCRFGDNMRQVAVTEGDKVAAEMKFGFSTNGYGVGDLVKTVDAVSDAEARRWRAEYEDALRRRARAPPRRRAPRIARSMARGSNWACAPFSARAGSRASPPLSRTCTA